ncbi:MAG: lipoate--protein ligase [Oscillospiraceae bacterium]|nr:lipoate--protein ligase [Oscillospiraceae bacterium]
MIYIETGSVDPYENFALESYLLTEKRPAETVFLFWRTRPTVMLGRHQNIYREVNLPYARARGVCLARRLSGGGTIYTDMGGWQFSFIEPATAPGISFRRYAQMVAGALRGLGVDVRFTGRNDLMVDGKKCSGNAQCVTKGYVLHHGSLLFDTDLAEMEACTAVDGGTIQTKGIRSVRERVRNLSTCLPAMDALAFKEAMVAGILRGGETRALTEEDRARVQTEAERFCSRERIYGRSPACRIVRSERLAGGLLEAHVDVTGETVTQLSLCGDFFSAVDVDNLCRALVGCAYDRASLLARLRAAGFANALYNITPEEIARVVAGA